MANIGDSQRSWGHLNKRLLPRIRLGKEKFNISNKFQVYFNFTTKLDQVIAKILKIVFISATFDAQI